MVLLFAWLSQPTEETRRDLAKEVEKVGENAKVAILISVVTLWMKLRNKKTKEITEDELKTLKRYSKRHDAVKHIDEMTANKEKKSWKSKNKQKKLSWHCWLSFIRKKET